MSPTNLEKMVQAISLLLYGCNQPNDTQRILIESFITAQGIDKLIQP
jgi:hypothetical protein